MPSAADYRRVELTGREIDLPVLEYGGYSESLSAHSVTRHHHEGWEILVLVKGALSWVFSDGMVLGPAHGGQIRLTPPKLAHRGVHDILSPNTFAWATIYPDVRRRRKHAPLNATEWEGLLGRFAEAGNCIFDASPTLLRVVSWLREALLRRNRESAMPETAPWIRSLFCQMILETSRSLAAGDASQDNLYVCEAVKFLRAHLGERIRVEDLLRFLGFGHTRVHEMFKRSTGLSPNDYLQRLRVETAQELLLGSEQSIGAVAAQVGFDTSQYFAAVFKKYTGQTPTTFRKAQRLPEADSEAC